MPPTTLDDWVTTLQASGHTREQVRTALIKKGFTATDIDRALEEGEGPKKPSLLKRLAFLAVLIVVVLMIPPFVRWLFAYMGW